MALPKTKAMAVKVNKKNQSKPPKKAPKILTDKKEQES
jgi:hypothetical protein